MRILTGILLLTRYVVTRCLLLLLAGSGALAAYSQVESSDSQPPNYGKPYLLYLLSSPHPGLYVEADAVEGCVPSDVTIKKLRDFLATYCNKPGGVEVVRGAVIPRSAAQGVSPEALARKWLKGPPDGPAVPQQSPAFMCMLFYDGHLSDEQPVTEGNGSGAKMPLPHRAPAHNPRADLLPYPTIYMNMRYGPKAAQDELVLHEAGHLLGLVSRTTQASDLHCQDRKCLMYKTLTAHLGRLLLGREAITQHRLCERCVTELAEKCKEMPPSNLRFVGPVLVRSEPGYYVLSLPDRVKLVVGDMTDQDCEEFAAAVRGETSAQAGEPHRVAWLVKEEMLREPQKAFEIIRRAKADPYDPVRFAASRTRTRAGTERYFAEGQYTNILRICGQSILADPADDWSYNQIAWIRATCPEASIRNGKEAVEDAMKACELSEWKNWDWIDTLAAAYAEVGDFKRASEFEEKALRTGNPLESDQREMRDRLSLYKKFHPFRDRP